MKTFLIWVLVIIGIITLSVVGWFCNQTHQVVDNAVIRYEEFQEIYNTCKKINTDLCNMEKMDENDKSFEQFTKAQRMNAMRTNLNKQVEEYNAKSKMWTRSLWKSDSLPHQLKAEEFSCY